MTMRKSYWAVLVAVLLLALGLAACGSQGAPDFAKEEHTPIPTVPPATMPSMAEAAQTAEAAAPAQTEEAAQPAQGEGAAEEVTVEVVAPLFQKGGCGSCHVIEGIEGAMGTLGPDLCVTGEAVQKGEKTIEDVIQDIVDPNAVVAEGYSPVMPTNFGDLYSQEELELMARYLATLTCKE